MPSGSTPYPARTREPPSTSPPSSPDRRTLISSRPPLDPRTSRSFASHMAALRIASAWGKRSPRPRVEAPHSPSSPTPSMESVDEPIRLDVDPFDENGAKKRWQPSKNRLRRGVSGKKPPVPPPLASTAFVRIAEEVQINDNTLDGTSPVSSFLDSAPSSPGVVEKSPEIAPPPALKPRPSSASRLDEIQALRRNVDMWDTRIDELEQRNHLLKKQVTRLSARFSRPRPASP
ncbi:unnamed protein product [Chondrus crispus]|uniref:Uncharacterized protein n=1 Tax=Chondrus crispus TaxID=2769 RepID=R7QI98_CHOCR|nr:unnamed protein product [Chondrus crispus]CDF37140.1 unnamed protein product [Chondrus crispus]|eukprot:XP_005716959.1 unnamed protein product [Chondrus crispus]